MMKEKTITIVSDRRNIVLKTGTILYVLMNRKYAEFHVLGDHVYKTRMTLAEIEEKLGDGRYIVAASFLRWLSMILRTELI